MGTPDRAEAVQPAPGQAATAPAQILAPDPTDPLRSTADPLYGPRARTDPRPTRWSAARAPKVLRANPPRLARPVKPVRLRRALLASRPLDPLSRARKRLSPQ